MCVRSFNATSGRIGVLTRDIHAGSFSDESVLFSLPKGLTVRDESPRGLNAIDLFEPHRYAIVLTTEDEKLIDFNSPKKHSHDELYSIDNRKGKPEKP